MRPGLPLPHNGLITQLAGIAQNSLQQQNSTTKVRSSAARQNAGLA
jgi:hypothetical protein